MPAYSLGTDFLFISWNNVGIGTFWLQVEQCIADFAVRGVERVTDTTESVADIHCVDVKRHFV